MAAYVSGKAIVDESSARAAVAEVTAKRVRHTSAEVDGDFQAWVDSPHLQEPDEGGDIGELAPGTMELLREVFDQHGGPVPLETLRQAGNDRQLALAHRGVELFSADLHPTTSLTPEIAIWRRGDDTLVVSYNGDYSAPGAALDPRARGTLRCRRQRARPRRRRRMDRLAAMSEGRPRTRPTTS